MGFGVSSVVQGSKHGVGFGRVWLIPVNRGLPCLSDMVFRDFDNHWISFRRELVSAGVGSTHRHRWELQAKIATDMILPVSGRRDDVGIGKQIENHALPISDGVIGSPPVVICEPGDEHIATPR